MKNMHGFGYKVFVGTVVAIVAATVGVGLWVAGSPRAERARREDVQRLNDLQSITAAVDTYYQEQRALPPSLDALKAKVPYYQPSKDPANGEPYEYETTSTKAYRLCATFSMPTPADQPAGGGPYPPYPAPVARSPESARLPAESTYPDFWMHGAGRSCFDVDESERIPDIKPANCQLMREQKTGTLGCYGCANGTCKNPPVGWTPYALPKDYIGVPYACTPGSTGCEMVQ